MMMWDELMLFVTLRPTPFTATTMTRVYGADGIYGLQLCFLLWMISFFSRGRVYVCMHAGHLMGCGGVIIIAWMA